jgi:hypothetical protein
LQPEKQFLSVPFAWDFSMHLTVVFISNVGDMRKDEDLLCQSPKTYGDSLLFPSHASNAGSGNKSSFVLCYEGLLSSRHTGNLGEKMRIFQVSLLSFGSSRTSTVTLTWRPKTPFLYIRTMPDYSSKCGATKLLCQR